MLILFVFPLKGVIYDVCIDPGHCGGSDGGAPGLNGDPDPNESDFNLDIALSAFDELEILGRTVLMTRINEDPGPPPAKVKPIEKAHIANGWRYNELGFKGYCRCAVSIHCNADTNNSPAHGTETFCLASIGYGYLLANHVHDAMCVMIDGIPYYENRGIKFKGLDFLKNTITPSCMPEVAFVTHPDGLLPGQWSQLEGNLWFLKTYAGWGIARGVNAFLGAIYPPYFLRIFSGQKASVSMEWESSETPGANYNVYRREHPSEIFFLIAPNISGTNYTDNSVEDGKTYSYYVTAVSGEDESIRSNVLTVHTPPFSSDYPIATGKNNGVKAIFDDNGINRLTYSSNSSMWYTYSTDYGNTWTMSQSVEHGLLPALAIDAANHPHIVSTGCAGEPDTASGSDTSYVIFYSQYLTNKWDSPCLYETYDSILSVSFAIDPLDTGWVVFNTYDDEGNNELKIGQFYTQTLPESLENVTSLDTYNSFGKAAIVVRPSDRSIWIVYERNNTIICKWRNSYGNWITSTIQNEGGLSIAFHSRRFNPFYMGKILF
ncbi:MAG: N-acetylmuramoyl-L-alanine amidase [bacterium]